MSNKLQQMVNTKRDKTALLIDVHNLTYRCVFVANKEDPLDKKFTYWKYLVLNNILNNIRLYGVDKCILAFDDRNYWRKDLYASYKAQRKAGRDQSPVDFEAFFPVMNEFFDDFKKAFKNIMYLQLPHCEADDIIAVLTRSKLNSFSEIINISTDKDMNQLMIYPNYKQFDPIKKKFVKHINPKKELIMKILTGDKGDNIPAVKPKCGPATAKKMIEHGLENELINKTVKENFERNKQLIDFDCIPKKISTLIEKAYSEYDIKPYDGSSTFNFFVKHRLNVFIDKIQEYTPSLKVLY
jgi:5'-3' exonuclease